MASVFDTPGWRASSALTRASSKSSVVRMQRVWQTIWQTVSGRPGGLGRHRGAGRKSVVPSLVLGPLLRHVDSGSATVWVETDGPCTVEILGATTRTWCVGGHHYALVCVDGLPPGGSTPY